MSDITFDQFQAQIQQAKDRMAASSKKFSDAVAAISGGSPLTLAEIDAQVDIDAAELKKLEGDMGEELNSAFIELAKAEGAPDDSEELEETEPEEEVEKKD